MKTKYFITTATVFSIVPTRLFLIIMMAGGLNLCPNLSFSQWTQKTAVGGLSRQNAVGFSIGNKGYIGTGISTVSATVTYHKDFWEYDKTANTWTQKADFAGGAREGAVGFSIGNKGYIGTGKNANYFQDFWEWNGDIASTAYNTWSQRANFGGGQRTEAVGFSLDSTATTTYGCVGTGRLSNTLFNDFWRYSQANDAWVQMPNLPGPARQSAVGFSIGTKGYIGTGRNLYTGGLNEMKDFYEWNVGNGSWVKKADFAGGRLHDAVGYSMSGNGYIGTGDSSIYHSSAIWVYFQAGGAWQPVSNFGGTARGEAVGFSIGNCAYIGTGNDGPGGNMNSRSDFWESCTSTGICNAAFTYTITGCTVCVTNTSTGGSNPTYKWNFDGSGLVSTLNPCHTYTASGTYWLAIYMYDPNYCDSTTKIITVNCPTGIFENSIAIGSIENFPNPFAASTIINYSIHESGNVEIGVYNLLGEKTVMLVNEEKPAGSYSVPFNAETLPAGIYMLELKVDNNAVMKKINIIR